MAHVGLNINPSDENKDEIIPLLGKSKRQIWQTLGTEWGRMMIHNDLWLLVAGDVLRMRGPSMVIPDVRFENEAQWVRRNGVMLHVTRPDAPGGDDHPSEAGVEVRPGDIVIANDGSLDDLFQKVRNSFSNVIKA